MAQNGSPAADPSRFSTTGAIWLRPDGVQPLASVSALFSSSPVLLAPVAQMGDGTYWQYSDPVLVGGTPDPTVAGTMANTCNNWTSNDGAQMVIQAQPLYAGSLFTSGTTSNSCQNQEQVLCLQQ
jgi:hypothetical protein